MRNSLTFSIGEKKNKNNIDKLLNVMTADYRIDFSFISIIQNVTLVLAAVALEKQKYDNFLSDGEFIARCGETKTKKINI